MARARVEVTSTERRARRSQIQPIFMVLETQGRKRIWLARQLGITKTALANYASGLRRVPPDFIDRACYVLNIPRTLVPDAHPSFVQPVRIGRRTRKKRKERNPDTPAKPTVEATSKRSSKKGDNGNGTSGTSNGHAAHPASPAIRHADGDTPSTSTSTGTSSPRTRQRKRVGEHSVADAQTEASAFADAMA